MANRCRLPIKDDCSFLFPKLHCYFLKFLVDKVHGQNKDVLDNAQHVICSLCSKCLSTLCSPLALHTAVPEVCSAQRCGTESERYSEINVHSSVRERDKPQYTEYTSYKYYRL